MANDGYVPQEQERGPHATPAARGFDHMLAGQWSHFMQAPPALPPAIVESLLIQKVNLLCMIAKQASSCRYQATFRPDDAPLQQAAARVEGNALAALDECVAALRTGRPDA